MKLINFQILLIQLFILIRINSNKNINYFRNLTELNTSYETSCNNTLDCFNCTLIPKCRWSWEKKSCITFEPFNEEYALPLLSNYISNNITMLNNHINFIRKSCFIPVNPYIENQNSYIYNNISLKYCGPHYIIKKRDTDFKIQIKNINGLYGTSNLLCEFIILSSPNFDINIKINEEPNNNFYLLYSPDSINFSQHITSSTTLSINNNNMNLHTFIFYGLKSFKNSPFIITYKETIFDIKKAVEATGYIMIALSCIMIIIIIIAIINIRKKSILFKKEKEKVKIFSDENEKLKLHYNNKNRENKKLKEKTSFDLSSNYINNFSPPTSTPGPFINKKAFVFENICCLCLNKIENKDDIKKVNCEHYYHINCFDKLIVNMKELNEKELKCVSCQKIIYSN